MVKEKVKRRLDRKEKEDRRSYGSHMERKEGIKRGQEEVE